MYDVLDERFLKTITVEDVNLFSAFWQSKLFQNMQEVYTGLDIIDNLGLWQEVIDGNEKDIDNMSMERLTPAIQRARLILLIRDVTKKEKKYQKNYKVNMLNFCKKKDYQKEIWWKK